jgi:hypothetical protein
MANLWNGLPSVLLGSIHLNGCKFNCFEILSTCALPVYSGYVDIGVNIVQKKVIETREQLRRIAQRLGIVLKSSERDMQVSLQASYWDDNTAL